MTGETGRVSDRWRQASLAWKGGDRVKRLDKDTVELTDDEMAASDLMENFLSCGYSIEKSVERVRFEFEDKLSEEFYAYLGE